MIKQNPAAIPVDWSLVDLIGNKILDTLINLKETELKNLQDRINRTKNLKHHINVIKYRKELENKIKEINNGNFLLSQLGTITVCDIPVKVKTKKKTFEFNKTVILDPKSKDSSFKFDLFGGGSATSSKLTININGSLNLDRAAHLAEVYKRSVAYLAKEHGRGEHLYRSFEWLHRVIAHELGHLADPSVDYKNKQGSSSFTKEGNWSGYYNVPTEVKARINEYTDYFKRNRNRFFNFDNFIKDFVRREGCWEYLTDENKKIMISALYAEWEKYHSKPPELTEFQKRKKATGTLAMARYFTSSIG